MPVSSGIFGSGEFLAGETERERGLGRREPRPLVVDRILEYCYGVVEEYYGR